MTQVSISKAARLAGCTRSNLYKTYIHAGKLTVTKDHQGKPQVDTAELLRVFGSLQGDSQPSDTVCQELTPIVSTEDTPYVKSLLAQLDDAKEREQWYRQQIGELTNTLKQLEHQRPTPFWFRWFK